MDGFQAPTAATPTTKTHALLQKNVSSQVEMNGATDPPLFSPELISPEVSSSLPDGYTMRPLRKSDYEGGKQSYLNSIGVDSDGGS